MIDKKMEAALNDQINEEVYSAYLYFAMSAYYSEQNLPGLANWMHVQGMEELTHASKFYLFIQDRGGHVAFKPIAAPPSAWKSPAVPFAEAFKHEQHITGCINKLVTLAQKVNDHASVVFLNWFVNEQVEEEKNASEMAHKTRLGESSPSALFFVDQEAGTRVFTPPAATTPA
jgi:ferritin